MVIIPNHPTCPNCRADGSCNKHPLYTPSFFMNNYETQLLSVLKELLEINKEILEILRQPDWERKLGQS